MCQSCPSFEAHPNFYTCLSLLSSCFSSCLLFSSGQGKKKTNQLHCPPFQILFKNCIQHPAGLKSSLLKLILHLPSCGLCPFVSKSCSAYGIFGDQDDLPIYIHDYKPWEVWSIYLINELQKDPPTNPGCNVGIYIYHCSWCYPKSLHSKELSCSVPLNCKPSCYLLALEHHLVTSITVI